MLVIADGDPALAEDTASELGRAFFDLRHEVTTRLFEMNEALDAAGASAEGPVVLADMGDNSGGGAPGDSTFLLRGILDRSLSGATGIYWDPVAVRICRDAGIGSDLRLRIGGKIGATSGDPVDLEARVMNIACGLGQHLGKGLEPMGTVVWLRTGDEVDILVNDLRTQVYHPEALEQLGIELGRKRLVTVKSLFHFYGSFQKVASRIIQVATPGGTSTDFASISYSKRNGPFWPAGENPLET